MILTTTATVSQVTETTAFLQWNMVEGAGSYTVRYRAEEGENDWIEVAADSAAIELSGLTEGTTYEAQVASVCGEATSEFRASVSFTTADGNVPPVQYCDAAGNNSNYFWIDLVRVGSMNNSSGNDGGYGDYTSLAPGTLVKGNSNSIVVSAAYSYWQFTLNWRIWIDYNQDGTFSDSEIFVSGTSNSAGELTATNSIPAAALNGTTRMHVSMKYVSYANPCGTFSFGEVEDYTVNIGNSASSAAYMSRTAEMKMLTEGMEDGLRTYPNPLNSSYLKLNTEVPAGIKMNIIDSRGATVKTIISKEGESALDVQDLKPGMYHLSIPTPLEAIHVQFIKQ
jgi:bacillolysin